MTEYTHLLERQLEDLLETHDAMDRQRRGQRGSSRAASEAAAGGGSAQPASSAPPLEALLGALGDGDAHPPPADDSDFQRWWAQQQAQQQAQLQERQAGQHQRWQQGRQQQQGGHQSFMQREHVPYPQVHRGSGGGAQGVPTPQGSGHSQAGPFGGPQQQQQPGLSGRYQQQATPSHPAGSTGHEEEETRWGWGALAAGAAAALGAAAISSWWKGRNQDEQQQQQEGHFTAGQQASASGRQRGAQGQAPEDSVQTSAHDLVRRLFEAQEARQREGAAHTTHEADSPFLNFAQWLREQPAEEGQPASRTPDVMALLLSAYEAYHARQAGRAHNA